MKRQIPVLLLCLALLLSACGGALPAGTEASVPPPREELPPAPEEPAVPEEPPPPEPTTATLAVCGDAMSHMPITNDAWNGERYDYARIMAAAGPYVETADYAVVNLETTLSGGPPYSGYPAFNSPDDLARDLKALGFDLCLTANNHSLDRGFSGLSRTLDVLDGAGLAHVGTSRTQEEFDHNAAVADVGGISVAFLAYTYGLNGFRIDDDLRFSANLFNLDYYTTLCNPDYQLLEEDMAAARALETDLIAVIVHWGNEYRTQQNVHQENLAQFLVGQGADLVLGGHPHVLQPYMTVTAPGFDGQEREGFVIYSLGNFISNQNFADDPWQDLATKTTVILDLELTKTPEGDASLTDVRYTPYYMLHRNRQPVGERRHLVNVHQAMAEYEAGDSELIDQRAYASLQKALDLCHEVLGPEGDRPSE